MIYIRDSQGDLGHVATDFRIFQLHPSVLGLLLGVRLRIGAQLRVDRYQYHSKTGRERYDSPRLLYPERFVDWIATGGLEELLELIASMLECLAPIF